MSQLLRIFEEECVADGYTMPAGCIKVALENGSVKYVSRFGLWYWQQQNPQQSHRQISGKKRIPDLQYGLRTKVSQLSDLYSWTQRSMHCSQKNTQQWQYTKKTLMFVCGKHPVRLCPMKSPMSCDLVP